MGSKRSKIVSVDHQLVQEAKVDAKDTKYPYSRVNFALDCVGNLTENALEYKHQRIPRHNCGCSVTEPRAWTTHRGSGGLQRSWGGLAQIPEGLKLVLLNVFRVSADLTHGVHARISILRQRSTTREPCFPKKYVPSGERSR
jgi:hypothetical protein